MSLTKDFITNYYNIENNNQSFIKEMENKYNAKFDIKK